MSAPIIPVVNTNSNQMAYNIDAFNRQQQNTQPQQQAQQQPQQQQGQPQGQGDPDFGNSQDRDTVRGYMQKLMNVTRTVPDTAARKGGPRGSPGSFEKLSQQQVDEFISAIIYGSKLFMPKSLSLDKQTALVCAEISIESAFQVGTSGVNPGDNSKRSVGPLQLTLGIWDDIFRQYANLNIKHYDGSAWNSKDTNSDALANCIFDNIVASLWCICEQGRRGCPEWFGGPDGPCPKTWRTSEIAWVCGQNAMRNNTDLDGQREMYIASETVDLQLLGLDVSLLDTQY